MDKRIEEVLDYSLLIAQSYLLLRILLSKNAYFKTPFFYFFLLTGGLGVLSVVGFIVASRFPIPEDRAWIFKFGYVINAFGVTGSTIGKLFISAHRFAVMRSIQMTEAVWSDRLKTVLTTILLFFSSCRCISVFFCGYSFVTKENITLVAYFEDQCTTVDKSESSVINLIFIFVSIIMTILTSRQLYKMQQNADTQTKKMIMDQQIKMFIIVFVCTISHLIKAMHQLCWVFVAYFHMTELNAKLVATYSYAHYLATYSASVTLIIVSPRVRKLLISWKDADETNGRTQHSTTAF